MTGHAYVAAFVARLRLKEFVTNWNAARGPKIANYSTFETALTYRPDLLSAFEAACEQAEIDGVVDCEEHLRSQMEPFITTSFLCAAQRVGQEWARMLAGYDPADYDAPAPFSDQEQWVDWMMADFEEPLEFCGPAGEAILEDEAIDHLLRQALLSERALAMRSGWIRSSVVLFSERRSSAQPTPA